MGRRRYGPDILHPWRNGEPPRFPRRSDAPERFIGAGFADDGGHKPIPGSEKWQRRCQASKRRARRKAGALELIMEIQTGQEYVTRSGKRARIYATDGNAPYVVHGSVFISGGWHIDNWMLNGANLGTVEDAMDLIGPWTPPSKAKRPK